MTNGEKIKGLYSLKEYLVENPIELEGHKSLPITLIDYAIEALEQEPTTKNDLGVDCVSRKAVDSLVWKYLRKETDDNIAFYEHFLDLPSVTPQEPILDKIRAEIIAEIYIHSGTGEEVIQAYDDGLKRGLDIIDKYKAESEVENGNVD